MLQTKEALAKANSELGEALKKLEELGKELERLRGVEAAHEALKVRQLFQFVLDLI